MLHYRRIPLAGVSNRLLLRIRLPSLPSAFVVLDTLLELAILSLVVLDTALRRTLLTVCLSAAKGTTQVLATMQAFRIDVSWMGDEENSAMLAASQTLPQVGIGSQNRP